MGPPSLKVLEEKTVDKLALLLQNLAGESGEQYHKRLTSSISKLPSAIKHRSRWLDLVDLLFLRVTLDDYAKPKKLCALHKSLSLGLIHEIFTLISLEVGHNTNALVSNQDQLTQIQSGSVHSLRELHSLWISPTDYTKLFCTAPNPQWPFQKSRCEGCILTHIGSDKQTVCGLRVLLKSRMRTKKPKPGHPRLLRVIDGWLKGLFGDEFLAMKQNLEMYADELKAIRKQLSRVKRTKTRHATRRTHSRRSVRSEPRHREDVRKSHQPDHYQRLPGDEDILKDDDGDPGEDAADSDFEDEIIDHYAALKTSMPADPMPTINQRRDSVLLPHPPADYSSQYTPPRREKAWLKPQEAPRPIKSSWFTVICPDEQHDPYPRSISGNSSNASFQAVDYQHLLDPEPYQQTPDSHSGRGQEPLYETRKDVGYRKPAPIPEANQDTGERWKGKAREEAPLYETGKDMKRVWGSEYISPDRAGTGAKHREPQLAEAMSHVSIAQIWKPPGQKDAPFNELRHPGPPRSTDKSSGGWNFNRAGQDKPMERNAPGPKKSRDHAPKPDHPKSSQARRSSSKRVTQMGDFVIDRRNVWGSAIDD